MPRSRRRLDRARQRLRLGFSSAGNTATIWDAREIVSQATWSSPVTNKLLLEAATATFVSHWGWHASSRACITQPGADDDRSRRRFNDVYRGLDNFLDNDAERRTSGAASASYVTGAHNMKFGYQGAYHIEDDRRTSPTTAQLALTDLHVHRARTSLLSSRMRIAPWQQSNRTRVSRVLRAGPVDARPADAAGRAALRPRLELVPGRATTASPRRRGESRRRSRSADRRRDRLQRHHAARRRRLRRVRQRQDGAQGERRQVPPERQQPGQLHDQQSRARRPQRTARPELPDDGVRGLGSTPTATTFRTATCST